MGAPVELHTATEHISRSTLRWWIVGAVVAALAVTLATVSLLTHSWHRGLVEERRLLPGTTVAGTDVGEATVAEARAVALDAAEEALDREVTLVDGGDERSVRPRDLGATTDAAEVVAAAMESTETASWTDLLRIRWFGVASDFDADVSVRVSEGESAALADELAAGIDRDPEDATVEWAGDGLALQEHRTGRQLDRAATAADVHAALEGATDEVALPVDDVSPAISTAMVEDVYPAVEAAVDEALDRTVTVTHGDATWELSPRDVGASPDVETALETALGDPADAPDDVAAAPISDQGAPAPLDVSVSVPEEEVAQRVEGMAERIDLDPRDASIDYSTGWVNLAEERAGRALDREAARQQLVDALTGDDDAVELPVDRVEPDVTTDAYRHVLLVRQNSRRLYLYVDGEITHDWPIAVGESGSATPTGVFTVGAKRHSPTWHNPSPNGWGADMPEVVGPGPDNPLGVRAINWNRGGHDTLIRFHGTNQTNSIGQAASQGCVRLTNSAVVELYDLVPSGATIVSLRA